MSRGLNDDSVAHKTLRMSGQPDVARLRSRLDDHLGKPAEDASLPMRVDRSAGNGQAYAIADAAGAIAVVDNRGNGVSPA